MIQITLPSTHPSILPWIHSPFCFPSFHWAIGLLFFQLFKYPLTHPAPHPSFPPSIHASICSSTGHPHICPSFHTSVHPSIHSSIHLYPFIYIHPSIHLSIHPSIHPSIHSFSEHLSCVHSGPCRHPSGGGVKKPGLPGDAVVLSQWTHRGPRPVAVRFHPEPGASRGRCGSRGLATKAASYLRP